MNENTDHLAEIETMKQVGSALAGLDEEARGRVLAWATSKFAPQVAVKSRSQGPDSGYPLRPETRQSDGNGNGGGEDLPQQDLATFFPTANARTDADKALVAAYWLQTSKGQTDIDASDVNGQLKHLGHGVTNITRSFELLIQTKPQLVIQTRKSGTTKQARKKYRVTAEGISRVKQMITAATQTESQVDN